MLVALLAIAVGATILSGLVTIYRDVPRQMGAQFRNYGANMIFLASGTDASFDLDAVSAGVSCIPSGELVGVTPYRYETVRIHEQPVVAAGTDFAGARLTSPYWHIDGDWPSAGGELLVGKKTADFLGLGVGDGCNVLYSDGEEAEDALNLGMDMRVSGILETGGSEEDYIYLSLADMETLAGETVRLDVAELSVSASAEALKAYERTIAEQVPAVAPRLVKRVTESESTVLTKLQSLVFLVPVTILVSVLVTGLACLLPVRSATEVDPALVLKGE